ncbi:MAG: hypothetical protein WCC14_17115 [Acidobacteriaceae bacterium]
MIVYILLLVLIGYAELRFLKARGAAFTTWFSGIAAAAVSIGYSNIPGHVALAFGALGCGIAAMFFWFRKFNRRS